MDNNSETIQAKKRGRPAGSISKPKLTPPDTVQILGGAVKFHYFNFSIVAEKGQPLTIDFGQPYVAPETAKEAAQVAASMPASPVELSELAGDNVALRRDILVALV